MRNFLIAGNWKMNKTTKEALEFACELKELLKNPANVTSAIIAPFTQLEHLKEALTGTGIKLGAQNVHYERSGAFTGEISVDMLDEIGIDFCVVGHSERRQYFAETDKTVNLKLKTLLAAGIKPILCVGESLEAREGGSECEFVRDQVISDFEGIDQDEAANVVIAYEPIWAIGTGRTATPEQAEDMCAFIRGLIEQLYGRETADDILILYGGSMKPENAGELLSKPDIDGGLIGGASLKANTFAEMAKTAAEL